MEQGRYAARHAYGFPTAHAPATPVIKTTITRQEGPPRRARRAA
jgi:hypothetical protein